MIEFLKLRCNGLQEPQCIDNTPVFSWNYKNTYVRGITQKYFVISLFDGNDRPVFEKKCLGRAMQYIYKGHLVPLSDYFWQVTARLSNGQVVTSAKQKFSTGLLGGRMEDMGAKWISGSKKYERQGVSFRKSFALTKDVAAAYGYFFTTAWQRVSVNGIALKDDCYLLPPNSSYTEKCIYEKYDLKAALKKGTNELSVLVGGGYNSGYSRWGWRLHCGKAMIGFLDISYTDGTVERICTEENWNIYSSNIAALHSGWESYLSQFVCQLPDENTQRMVNIWNPYQAERNFQFSRNISYYATGTFRGVGYRDTAQDVLAMVPFDTERAKEKIKLLLTQQYQDGHVNHYFFPTEGWDPVTSIHSDDHLWTVLSCYALIMEEGSLEFLNQTVPYYDGGEGSVWEHINKSIDFTLSHLGTRGFPLMLRSDWNDQLFRVCKEGKGESIWTAMQFGVALKQIAELARLRGESDEKFITAYNQQKKLVNTLGWDGKWFRRAIMDDGRYLGSDSEEQAKIWLNTQTWAVISGMAEGDKGRIAMDSVYEMLNTPMGIKKIHPSIKDYPSKENPLTNYNKGTGENGAVFCHANTWAIIAECMLGRGERAYQYYTQLLPMLAQEKAGEWRYRAEPYVYASNIFGPESDKFGLANVSWLSGTAAWMYIAVTQYILGIKPTWEGLEVKPCLPAQWKWAKATRKFRGKEYSFNLR